jgi:hypothetical protein
MGPMRSRVDPSARWTRPTAWAFSGDPADVGAGASGVTQPRSPATMRVQSVSNSSYCSRGARGSRGRSRPSGRSRQHTGHRHPGADVSVVVQPAHDHLVTCSPRLGRHQRNARRCWPSSATGRPARGSAPSRSAAACRGLRSNPVAARRLLHRHPVAVADPHSGTSAATARPRPSGDLCPTSPSKSGQASFTARGSRSQHADVCLNVGER